MSHCCGCSCRLAMMLLMAAGISSATIERLQGEGEADQKSTATRATVKVSDRKQSGGRRGEACASSACCRCAVLPCSPLHDPAGKGGAGKVEVTRRVGQLRLSIHVQIEIQR